MQSEPIPEQVRAKMAADPTYKRCLRSLALSDHTCAGRVTWEHALLYAGRRVNEWWSIVPLCAWAHSVDQFQDGGGMVKEINEWLALSRVRSWRAVNRRYPRQSWPQRLKYLEGKYGRLRLSGGR